MKSKIAVFCIFCLTLFVLSAVSFADENREEMAMKAANEWLMLVDEGKYSESWDNAAEYFKISLSSREWEKSLAAVRTPLGKLIRRVSKAADYHTSLSGAPDGEYVVIIYETSFAHKRSATETVTPMRQKDGSWKVSGYYIK
jgi:hypothetical protein